ncbi:helix-turn-helix transcriptional regulator [Sphingomonas sp. STIS6.2]|uniref:helix-turn-helix transcriptional regulator n=1 Tax=Sphingomonas sp. STIS6.2 TaxID=1379700 RepID=UPI0004DB6277|nr:AlpA family phage regulatory protein [Sphingomonas sp. STIS6.2]
MTDLLNDRLLKLAQVIEITGLSKAMVYRLVSQAKFPKPCKPGGIATRWVESEVRAWRVSVEDARSL